MDPLGVSGGFGFLGGDDFRDKFPVVRGEHRERDDHRLAGVAEDGDGGGVGFDEFAGEFATVGRGPDARRGAGCFRDEESPSDEGDDWR